MAQTAEKSSGFGKLLIVIYWIFSLSAGARAFYQLIRKFDQAPVSISLSAVSAVIYIVACICLMKKGPAMWRWATIAVSIEMIGVLAVGVFSLLHPELFPKASVWSHFGQGYGYVPLVLPMVGLWWLSKTKPSRQA